MLNTVQAGMQCIQKKCFRDLMYTYRLYDSLSFPPNAGLYLDTKVMRVGSDTFCDLFIQNILQSYAKHLIMLIIMEDC